jgi:hypothetical protein
MSAARQSPVWREWRAIASQPERLELVRRMRDNFARDRSIPMTNTRDRGARLEDTASRLADARITRDFGQTPNDMARAAIEAAKHERRLGRLVMNGAAQTYSSTAELQRAIDRLAMIRGSVSGDVRAAVDAQLKLLSQQRAQLYAAKGGAPAPASPAATGATAAVQPAPSANTFYSPWQSMSQSKGQMPAGPGASAKIRILKKTSNSISTRRVGWSPRASRCWIP